MLFSLNRTLLTLVVIVLPLRAEPSLFVSLESVHDRVRSQNPDLGAARIRIQQALARVNHAGRLPNPELETSLEHNPNFREGRFEIGVSQRFPITERLRLEKEISSSEMQAAAAEVREAERKLVAQARETIVKILVSRMRRQLLREQSETLNEFSHFLSDSAAKGEGSSLDAGFAKLDAASFALQARQLDAEEVTLVGELKPLLGMHAGESLSVGGDLPPPALPSPDSDLSRRPDLQAAKLTAAAAGQGVALEQARRYDDFEGGIFAGAERTEDAPDGYDNEAVFGLRFKIPLPLWNKNEGPIHEAEATQKRKEMEAVALSRNIHLEAQAARASMQEWAMLIHEINQNLLPQADEQSALAETAFRKGQSEIQSVLRSREKRLQLAAARLDALREFHLARVRHQTALGKN